MNFLEKSLEDIIYESPRHEIEKRGLTLPTRKLYRQVKIGNYGIADLIGFSVIYDNKIKEHLVYVELFELKKDSINEAAFWQSMRYAKGLQNWLEKRFPHIGYNLNIILIGSSIDNSSNLCYLPEIICNNSIFGGINLCFYTYKYNFNGISFNHHSGYKLIEEGF